MSGGTVCTLLHVEDEPFKIFALRMVDIDGMIGGLVQLMQNPHFSMSLSSSRKDSRAEVLLRYHLRATEGEQDASVLDLLQSFDVQADISLQRIVQSRAVLGESGWIKNDEIIAVVVTVEIIESIVADGLMALITRKFIPTLSFVSSIAFALLSTECTTLAPPLMA